VDSLREKSAFLDTTLERLTNYRKLMKYYLSVLQVSRDETSGEEHGKATGKKNQRKKNLVRKLKLCNPEVVHVKKKNTKNCNYDKKKSEAEMSPVLLGQRGDRAKKMKTK